MSTRRSARISCLLSLLVTLGAGSCSSPRSPASADDQSGAATPLQVEFAPVELVEVDREIATTGSIVAEETVTVSTESSGVIRRTYFDVGDFVATGDLLLEIDGREYQLHLSRQRANLEEALARVGATDPNHLPEPEDTTAVRQARALLDESERNRRRAEELAERGALSRAEYDRAATSKEVAVLRYQDAIEEARNRMAAIRSLQSAVELAEKNLSDTRIHAPVSAYVGQRHAAAGEYVRENSPVYTLVQSQRLKLVSEVAERDADVVQPGVEVLFNVDAFPEREFAARIERVSPTVDEQTRTFEIEALIEQVPGNRLKPGFFARCRILAGRRQALLVPPSALFTLAGVTKVFVRDGDRLVERLVETGRERNGKLEIRSGVGAGESVAVSRLADLTDGQRIE